MTRRTIALAILTLALTTTAYASWYDDYDAGLIAAKKGNWSTVAQKMTAAIGQLGKENSKARTYGMDFRNYRPYYYRGVAYLNLGKYEQAIADFEATGGPGPENLGDIGTLLDRAKKMAAASSEPDPTPTRVDPPVRTTPPVVTPPVVTQTTAPVAPQIDPGQRQRASAALTGARQKLEGAQRRRATTSQQYSQASAIFNDATTRLGRARTNEDLSSVISLAENAGDLAELAMPATAPPPVATTTPSAIVPKRDSATKQVIDQQANAVKMALEQYFAGEFEEAAARFERLTSEMPNNGWIYAFLGASQYSIYAFEDDKNYRKAALKSFRKAKQLRTWNGGLPSKYFSKRIRNAFREEG